MFTYMRSDLTEDVKCSYEKVLGYLYDPENDELHVAMCSVPDTKRGFCHKILVFMIV